MEQIKNIKKDLMLGKKITSCYRLFTDSELDFIPKDIRDEEADGITYLVLDNKICLTLCPNSENFTINYKFINIQDIPIDKVNNVSDNSFWQSKINKKIISMNLLYDILSSPFGVQIELENMELIEFLYVSESKYTFDSLIIK